MTIRGIVLEPATPDMTEVLCALQRRCYADPFYHEDEAVFRRILQEGLSLVAFVASSPIGYALVQYVEDASSVPELNRASEAFVLQRMAPPPHHATFIHDVSVDPVWRGNGVATRLVRAIILQERTKNQQITLVSVKEALSFWERLGFRPSSSSSASAILSYGPGAQFMTYLT